MVVPMMSPPPESLKDRLLDVVFGRRATAEELEFAKTTAPPEYMQMIYRIVMPASVGAVLVALLWSEGWLPFVASQIDRRWVFLALGLNIAIRFLWEGLSKHYERRAKARLSQPV